MVIIEHPFHYSQTANAAPVPAAQPETGESKPRQRPPIGQLLRDLRGAKTLRQVEGDTGITNAYLSNIELGLKRPGLKTLAKLGLYYQVPLEHLMRVAGLEEQAPEPQPGSVMDIQRAYGFVLGDPNVAKYQKPAETPSVDMQKFVVEMYQHFTGRKLL